MFLNRVNISNYTRVDAEDQRSTSLIQDDNQSIGGYEGSTSSFDYDEEFELLVKAYMRDMNYTTLGQASLNIVYSILNAGLIALPFTTQEAGVPLFTGVFILVAVLSAYTSIMVVAMANEQRVRTLEDLAESAFGKKGFVAVSICQIIFSYSLMCVTLDIWADIMSDVFREINWGGWLCQTRNGQVLLGACIVFPLCLLKKSMSSIKWTSYVTVFAVVAALLAVVATYVTDSSVSDNIFTTKSVHKVIEPRNQWWAVIFISVFCFSCNQKVFIIYSSLRRRSTERWQKATVRSSITVTLIYLFFGIFGYISKFRKEILLDNFNYFLSNADERKEVFDPSRAVLAFSLLLTIPVDCLVCATTWRRLYSKYVKRYDERVSEHYREVNCCDVVYAPLLTNESDYDTNRCHYDADLPNAKQVGNPFTLSSAALNDDTSDDDIEVPETSPSAALLISDSERSRSVNNSSKPRRKRFRRSRSRKNTSSTVKFDNSQGSNSGGWSYLRSLLVGDATSKNVANPKGDSLDKNTASHTTSEDPHLSTVRESLTEGASFRQSITGSFNGERPSFTGQRNTLNNDNITNHNSIGNSEIPQNASLTNTANITDGRASSLDEKMFGDLLDEEVPLCPTRNEFVPTLIIWLLTLGLCSLARHWLYIASILSVGTTLALTFIFPSLMYFRLGLLSDFQAIPIFGEIVPNRLYMGIIKYLGVALVVFDLLLMACLLATNENIIQKEG